MGDKEGRPWRILAIVEVPGTRQFLERLLGPDHRLHACVTGRDALATILRQEFDAVICTAPPPDLTCVLFQRTLAMMRPHLGSRVVYLEGRSIDPESRAFLAAPGRIAVTAPATRETLIEALARAMRG